MILGTMPQTFPHDGLGKTTRSGGKFGKTCEFAGYRLWLSTTPLGGCGRKSTSNPQAKFPLQRAELAKSTASTRATTATVTTYISTPGLSSLVDRVWNTCSPGINQEDRVEVSD